uniref:TRAF-interacting protein n=1 Tax=Salmo trutta TaxID=8032 RepID=A0A673YVR0_SALTR
WGLYIVVDPCRDTGVHRSKSVNLHLGCIPPFYPFCNSLQWFQTAPNKTCPQCRKQASIRHINKLFFDIHGEEEGSSADPESLQNELDGMKAVLSTEGKRPRLDGQTEDSRGLKGDCGQAEDLDIVRKEIGDKEILSSQGRMMKYLENQQCETQAAKEEARRLRTKMKTYESLDVVLQGQRTGVESMITDMGVGQAACGAAFHLLYFSQEVRNIKLIAAVCYSEREVFASNNKLHKATMELNRTKDDMKASEEKVVIVQKTLSTLTHTNEALSRLVFESPAPVELKQPRLHQPANSEDIALNMTFDIITPDPVYKRLPQVPSKKMLSSSPTKHQDKALFGSKAAPMDTSFRNANLFRKKTFVSMLDPKRIKLGAVRSGYGGLGGRTKFVQPIRPLMMKAKRKKMVPDQLLPRSPPALLLTVFWCDLSIPD